MKGWREKLGKNMKKMSAKGRRQKELGKKKKSLKEIGAGISQYILEVRINKRRTKIMQNINEWYKKKELLEKKKSPSKIGREEKKLVTLLEEIKALLQFSTEHKFEFDTFNTFTAFLMIIERIKMDKEFRAVLENGNISEEEKDAIKDKWWETIMKRTGGALLNYEMRIKKKYKHKETQYVVLTLFNDSRFTVPFNEIVREINECIKKSDIIGLVETGEKAEQWCREMEAMLKGKKEIRQYKPSEETLPSKKVSSDENNL
jgi:hypothetical protein